jgi:hypothetical protein
MTNLPHITNKQQDILRFLYRFRYLDRIQIQAFLGHQDKRRSSRWLKDLRSKQYIDWIYDPTDFTNRTKPAIYYLSINGIRYLRDQGIYPSEELRKRYRETSRQQPFISRCLLVAGCCQDLEAKSASRTRYAFVTAADYMDPANDYYFLAELQPHLCFVKRSPKTKTGYLLEIFDITTPRYMVKKRLNDYVQHLSSSDWESETGDSEPPTVLIVCPTKPNLIYAKRRTRQLLALTGLVDYEEDIEDEAKAVHIRFATTEQVKRQGVTAMIWEEA